MIDGPEMEEQEPVAAAAKKATPAPSVESLISSSSHWTGALFTTFTLSLTFFETQLLPALRKCGCDSVTVLVDAVGYRDSLMEQRALAVGREYVVVPVQLRTAGIFHPKLVYLQAKQLIDDILMVGSGNLTQHGHGRNIEVLDVLRPATNATAFEQAGAFFEALVAHPNIAVADPAPAMAAAVRLRRAAKASAWVGSSLGGHKENASFIHSLHDSGLSQFELAAREVSEDPDAWDELLVLSPYHHPKAQPVRRLMQGLGVSRLAVGVPARPRETCAFPFQAFAEHPRAVPIRAVKPVTPAANTRRLHAKWLELRGRAGAVVLTGSFNATHESLGGTNNVECGVVRVVDKASTVWEDAEVPLYAPNVFPTRTGQSSACVFAVLDDTNTLSGWVLGGETSAGSWEASLETTEDHLAHATVELNQDGRFHWPLVQELGTGAPEQTLQVTLQRADRRAVGWVLVQRVLRMSSRQRSLDEARRRRQSGGGTPEDRRLLCAFYSDHAWQLVHSLKTEKVVPDSDTETDVATDGFPVAPAPAAQPGDGHGSDASAEPQTPREEQAMAQWPTQDDLSSIAGMLSFLRGLNNPVSRDDARGDTRHEREPTSRRPLRADSRQADDGVDAEGDEGDANSSIRKPPKRIDRSDLDIVRETLDAMERARVEVSLLRERSPLPWQRERAAVAAEVLLFERSAVVISELLTLEGQEEYAREQLWHWLLAASALAPPGLAMADAWRQREDDVLDQACGVAACYVVPLRARRHASHALTADIGCAEAPYRARHLQGLLASFYGRLPDMDDALARAAHWLSQPGRELLVQDSVERTVADLGEALAEPSERKALHRLMHEGWNAAEHDVVQVFEPAQVAELRVAFAGPPDSKPQTRRFCVVDRRTLNGCPACNLNLLTPQPPRAKTQTPNELRRDLARDLWSVGYARCPNSHCKVVLVDEPKPPASAPASADMRASNPTHASASD